MLLVPAVHVKLLDALDAKLLLFELDLVCIGCEPLCKVSHRLGEGGREEDDLYRFGNFTASG